MRWFWRKRILRRVMRTRNLVLSACAVGYSRRQLDRLFQKHLRMTLYEYINAVLLSESAAELLDTDREVLDVALDCHFGSHEGYTRSFARHFFVTPKEYRQRKIAIPLFTQHPVNHYYILKGGRAMETTAICTVTPVTRPKRKLIYLPSHGATGYFDYCEEMGCQWEGVLPRPGAFHGGRQCRPRKDF